MEKSPSNLTPEQENRYGHQIHLPGMSKSAQLKLLSSKVLVLGLGYSSETVAQCLAQSGTGVIGLMDDQHLNSMNFQPPGTWSTLKTSRSTPSTTEELSTSLNEDVTFRLHRQRFDVYNLEEILRDYELVIDCLSNWQHKLLLSDVCMQVGTPLVHTGITSSGFQLYVMFPGKSACLRCVFSILGQEVPPNQNAGNFLPVEIMAAASQCAEAIKILCRLGVTSPSELIQFDALRREFHRTDGLTRQADCPDCGGRFRKHIMS